MIAWARAQFWEWEWCWLFIDIFPYVGQERGGGLGDVKIVAKNLLTKKLGQETLDSGHSMRNLSTLTVRARESTYWQKIPFSCHIENTQITYQKKIPDVTYMRSCCNWLSLKILVLSSRVKSWICWSKYKVKLVVVHVMCDSDFKKHLVESSHFKDNPTLLKLRHNLEVIPLSPFYNFKKT